jgi:hypothetical protein
MKILVLKRRIRREDCWSLLGNIVVSKADTEVDTQERIWLGVENPWLDNAHPFFGLAVHVIASVLYKVYWLSMHNGSSSSAWLSSVSQSIISGYMLHIHLCNVACQLLEVTWFFLGQAKGAYHRALRIVPRAFFCLFVRIDFPQNTYHRHQFLGKSKDQFSMKTSNPRNRSDTVSWIWFLPTWCSHKHTRQSFLSGMWFCCMCKSKLCSAIALFLNAENPLWESPKTNGTGPKCTPNFHFMHSNLEWKSVHSNFFFFFFWSGELSTPIYLEWTPFHSKIFHFLGVNNYTI